MTPRSLLILALGAALTTACGEPVRDYLAEHRELATAQLHRVARVREIMRALPPAEWPTMRDPGPLAICDLVIPPHRDAGCDTWVIDQAQLDNPRAFLDPPPLVAYGQADWLVFTTSLLETGRYPPNARYPDGDEPDRLTRPITYAFSWLLSLRFLIVVRTDELVPPRLADDQKSYSAGSFRGEAVLFSLRPEPTALGSVPFSHAMVGDVKVRMHRGRINAAQLDKAFADGVRKALAEALVARLKELERPAAPPR